MFGNLLVWNISVLLFAMGVTGFLAPDWGGTLLFYGGNQDSIKFCDVSTDRS